MFGKILRLWVEGAEARIFQGLERLERSQMADGLSLTPRR